MYVVVDVGINQVLFTGAFHEVNYESLYYKHIYTRHQRIGSLMSDTEIVRNQTSFHFLFDLTL